jgi:sRNA-binding protein
MTASNKHAANATIAADLFPATFSRERWYPHKPLKIGIDRDLVASGVFTQQEVRAVLWACTRRYQYSVAIARGGSRFNLNREPCSEITTEQQAAAASIAASHVEAIAENQLRDSRAQFYSARSTKPKETPQPLVRLAATNQAPAVSTTSRSLTLPDLRRLGQERKAAATNQNVSGMRP